MVFPCSIRTTSALSGTMKSAAVMTSSCYSWSILFYFLCDSSQQKECPISCMVGDWCSLRESGLLFNYLQKDPWGGWMVKNTILIFYKNLVKSGKKNCEIDKPVQLYLKCKLSHADCISTLCLIYLATVFAVRKTLFWHGVAASYIVIVKLVVNFIWHQYWNCTTSQRK